MSHPACTDRDTDEAAELRVTLKQLQKSNRILTKKLARSEADRVRLEEVNCKKEALLKQVISELQASQSVLENKSGDLEKALFSLQQTQVQLIESEKLAALGRLVAGVAHEINTPIGTGITMASTLVDETQQFQMAIAQGKIKRSILNHYTGLASESAQLILTNLHRAAELIRSFKQVAADQTYRERRTFDLRAYLQEVMVSLSPQLRKTSLQWNVTGKGPILIDSYPGAFAQIVTNLVTNSLRHGYGPQDTGQLLWHLEPDQEQVVMTYQDNGRGIALEHQTKVFEPFFTTARDRGGTGLGLSILYNLVHQRLQGTVSLVSQPGEGVLFTFQIPIGEVK